MFINRTIPAILIQPLTSPLLTSSANIITDPGGTQDLDTDTRAAREQWVQVAS